MIHRENVLTAYNKDVQRYLTGGCTTAKKNKILSYIEEKVISAGKSFEKLFPSKSKRNQAMDRILFLMSGTGICKVESKTVAESVGCSVRTVSYAVKALKETGEILVGGLSDGENKYVFVLKSHANFKNILKDVFFLDSLPEETAPIAEPIAEQVAELSNAETVGTVGVEGSKKSSNYNNSFNSLNLLKQERNIIIQAIENELIEAEAMKDMERVQTYLTDEREKAIHKQIHMQYSHNPIITKYASLFVLRASSIGKLVVGAMFRSLLKIDCELRKGASIDSIPSYFGKIYAVELESDKISEQHYQQQWNDVPAPPTNKVPFYNWLEDRG